MLKLESSCAGKDTVDIDTPITSRDGDRKIMQPIRFLRTARICNV